MAEFDDKRLRLRWKGMRSRCFCSAHAGYANYGGRGITVCAEWKRYQAFKEWALSRGFREGLDLDRIDNNGPYAPWNCRWVTRSENNFNRRTNVFVELNGETMTQQEAAARAGLTLQGLRHRIANGIPLDKPRCRRGPRTQWVEQQTKASAADTSIH